MKDIDVLIVGGGISGLSVAWWLAQNGIHSEIWEQNSRLGGKIRSHYSDGYLTEQAASLIINFRPEINRLLKASGLDGKKVARSAMAEAHRYLFNNGKLQPVPSRPAEMLFSPLWSWHGKMRLLAELFIPKGGGNNETVAEFINRRLGSEVLEKAMEPFVGGTLAADADHANARTTLPRLTALEQRYGSITLGILAHRLLRRHTTVNNEAFSFHGGMSTLVQSLAAASASPIHTGRKIIGLVRDGSRWRVSGCSGNEEYSLRARHVVISTPANAAAQLLRPLNSTLGSALDTIAYAPLAIVHMGFSRQQIRHPLDGSGFLTPAKTGLAFNGNLWMSSLFPSRTPEGKVLLTSYAGGCRAPQMINWGHQALAAAVCRDLKPVLGLRGEPEWLRIDQHEQALPLYHGNYQQRLSTIGQQLQQLPGLHLAANYKGGISVRDRILCGAGTAKTITQQLNEKQTTTGSFSVGMQPSPGLSG